MINGEHIINRTARLARSRLRSFKAVEPNARTPYITDFQVISVFAYFMSSDIDRKSVV